MTDVLVKLTGQKPISMYDFIKLHGASSRGLKSKRYLPTESVTGMVFAPRLA
jgi:hypothetical protein